VTVRETAISGVAVVEVFDPWVERVDILARRCTSARDVETLAQLATEIRAVTAAMIESDAGGGLVARTLSALNDALTVRIIALAAARHRLPPAAWCWLALGSEGRGEQTFLTDQDNGIIFSASDAAEARALRPLFMACAGEVNGALAACGFPLCDGGIMAGNADCCLSLAEWQERFTTWVRTPEPQALLNATIFFDFRAIYGDERLTRSLREHLHNLTRGADAFLRMLADNALAAAPPLGLVRDFAAKDGVVDLKKFGARLFVDAARILGLSCSSSSTVARLRHAVIEGGLPSSDAEAAIGAFQHLQRIRLLNQYRALVAGEPPANQLALQQLNAFDRRVLHEALKQARLLQQRLKITFRIEG
jgi:CBS domain-containing protein